MGPVQGVDAIPNAPISGTVISASSEPASDATKFAIQNVIRPDTNLDDESTDSRSTLKVRTEVP